MIVIDVEATGVNPEKCSLLSVGAIDFANPNNTFYEECRAFPGAHVEEAALAVAGFTRAQIADTKKKTDREVAEQLLTWLTTCANWTLAGQNPSFDRDFLQHTARRHHLNWPLAHRTIDLHSICYYHLRRRGIEPPLKNNHSGLDLDAILVYVGLPARGNAHHALADARLEAEAFARLLNDRSLFPDFAAYPIPWVNQR